MKGHLQKGLQFFLQGFVLILKPGMRRYLILPLGINILLLSLLIFVVITYIHSAFSHWVLSLASWAVWLLGGLLWSLFSLCTWLLGSSLLNMLSNLIASPFYSRLAQHTVKELTPTARLLTGPPPFATKELSLAADLSVTQHPSIYQFVALTLIREIKKIVYTLPWLLLGGLCFLLPFTMPFAPALWIVISGWLLAMHYVDYAADSQGVSFREMRRVLKQEPLTVLGFGLCVGLSLLIPGASLIVPAAAVAGAAALWQSLV
jgi:CysZ protein